MMEHGVFEFCSGRTVLRRLRRAAHGLLTTLIILSLLVGATPPAQAAAPAAALYINALGNSGHPNMLMLLDSYFNDSSMPVKNAAYFALRKALGPAVETKLAIDLGKEGLPQGAGAILNCGATRQRRSRVTFCR